MQRQRSASGKVLTLHVYYDVLHKLFTAICQPCEFSTGMSCGRVTSVCTSVKNSPNLVIELLMHLERAVRHQFVSI